MELLTVPEVPNGDGPPNAPSPSSTDASDAEPASRTVEVEDDVTLTGKVSVWEF